MRKTCYIPIDRVSALFHLKTTRFILFDQPVEIVCSRYEIAEHLAISSDTLWLRNLSNIPGYTCLPKVCTTHPAKYAPTPETLQFINSVLAGSDEYFSHPCYNDIVGLVQQCCNAQMQNPSTDSVYVWALLEASKAISRSIVKRYSALHEASKGTYYQSPRNKCVYDYEMFRDDVFLTHDQRPFLDPIDSAGKPFPTLDTSNWYPLFYDYAAEAVRERYPNIHIRHADMAYIIELAHVQNKLVKGDASPAACASYFQMRYGLNGNRIRPSIDPIDKIMEDLYLGTMTRVCAELDINMDPQWKVLTNDKVRKSFMNKCDALTKDVPILGTFRTLLALTRNVNDFMHLNPTKI